MNESSPLPEEITPVEPGPEELAAADQEIREDAPYPGADSTTAEATDAPTGEGGEDETGEDETGEAEPDIAATGTIGQLPAEDTLEDRGGRDILDESITAPDAPGPLYEETVADETRPDTIDERAEAEVPEVWEEPSSQG